MQPDSPNVEFDSVSFLQVFENIKYSELLMRLFIRENWKKGKNCSAVHHPLQARDLCVFVDWQVCL